LKLSRDGWAGLVILAASLVLFALTLDLKANALVPIGPGFYPRLVIGLTAALAGPHGPAPGKKRRRRRVVRGLRMAAQLQNPEVPQTEEAVKTR